MTEGYIPAILIIFGQDEKKDSAKLTESFFYLDCMTYFTQAFRIVVAKFLLPGPFTTT